MAYVLVQGGIVVQKQPYAQDGFVEAPDSVVCGYTYDGHTFAPPTSPAPIPQVISRRQFRQSLTHFGYRANVDAAVGNSNQDIKDWYADAGQFERTHPVVLSMAQQLGYTSDQLDAVWTYGASI